MKPEQVFGELLETTGEWVVPEFTKILDGNMLGSGKHEFTLLTYTYPYGETVLKVTIEEVDEEGVKKMKKKRVKKDMAGF